MTFNNLLEEAKREKEKRNWIKSAKLYDLYIKNNDNVNIDTRVEYAEVLRRLGRIRAAEQVLITAKSIESDNELVLQQLFKLYDAQANWKKAKKVSDELIGLDPHNSNYYFNMGRVYAFLNQYDQASNFYLRGLEIRHNISLEKLLEEIKGNILEKHNTVTSKYMLTAGRNNLGAFLHSGEKEAFTKISRYSHRDNKREKLFYEEISNINSNIKSIVPLHYSSVIKDNILYLTLEKINRIPINRKHIKDVIRTATKINSVRYKDLSKKFPNPNYMFQMRNRPIAIVIFFTKIHKRNINKLLFKTFKKLLADNEYPGFLLDMVDEVEELVISHKIYTLLDPEEHYTLLHGDFIPSNILVDKENGKIKIIDWATFTIGPRFMDVARYVTALLLPYDKVKEVYLEDINTGGRLSLVESIFFHYALILLYILTVKEKKIESHYDTCIYPGFVNFKKLLEKLTIKHYQTRLENTLYKYEVATKSIEELEKQINDIELNNQQLLLENQQMQERHQKIVNSKSWRITQPLRNLMLKISKND